MNACFRVTLRLRRFWVSGIGRWFGFGIVRRFWIGFGIAALFWQMLFFPVAAFGIGTLVPEVEVGQRNGHGWFKLTARRAIGQQVVVVTVHPLVRGFRVQINNLSHNLMRLALG